MNEQGDAIGPFLALRRYLAVAHHVPGRIRLRLDPRALSRTPERAAALLGFPFSDLAGIHSVRINRAALSVVIEYEPATIPGTAWDALLNGGDEDMAGVVSALDDRWRPTIEAWHAGTGRKGTR